MRRLGEAPESFSQMGELMTNVAAKNAIKTVPRKPNKPGQSKMTDWSKSYSSVRCRQSKHMIPLPTS